jgi:hypothetical protein
MLRVTSELLGRQVDAYDGRLGTIEDFFLDERDWRLRGVVLRAGLPIRREHLLIEAAELRAAQWPANHLTTSLTRREARRHVAPFGVDDASLRAGRGAGPPGRSLRRASTYRLSARDGYAGRVRDFVVDDRTWSIAHIEAEIMLFIGSKPVLIPTHLVDEFDATARSIAVRLKRHTLGGVPRYQRLALQSRLYQMCLYDYYANAEGAPLMRPGRSARPNSVDARMLLSTMVD